MSKREDNPSRYAEPEPIESGVHTDIPRRLRLSSREIGVAVVLTFAALLQLYWSLTKEGEKLTSAIPHLDPAAVSRHAR
jgi:hypothetical protein